MSVPFATACEIAVTEGMQLPGKIYRLIKSTERVWLSYSRSAMVIAWSIIMPSIKPAWATLVVLSFVATWNDYFTPLIYTTSQAMRTMPLALQTIAGGVAANNIGRLGAVAAATLIMITPTIVLFTLMQRLVMQTMTHSGIKG